MTIPSTLPPEAPESLVTPASALFSAPPAESRWNILRRDSALQILLGVALVFNLALFAYLALRFANLPDPLPLHFDATGLPDRIESKTGIFALPLIGLVVFVLNVALGIPLHRRERAATNLLTTGTLLVQILMWLATLNIVG